LSAFHGSIPRRRLPRASTGFVVGLLLLAGTTPALAQAVRQGRARLPLADSLAGWYALGINAHHLCAGLWVVGRDHVRSPEAVVAEDIAPFPAFRWEPGFEYTIDAIRHIATVRDARFGSRSAKYSGDQGCAILPAGSVDVFFAPAAVAGRLPAAASQDWPMGDRNAAATFPDVDQAALEAALDWAWDEAAFTPAQHTRGIVVVYRDRIVAERYAPGWSEHTPQISWSMGKSIAATLIGVLIRQGRLRLDQPAPVPEWQQPNDPRRSIRIADLMHMSSGLDFDNFGLDPAQSYTAANEHFRVYFDALDVAAHAVNQPLRYEPGTVWRYRNSDPLTLMRIARNVAEADGEDALAFPYRLLFDRIGIRNAVLETDAWGNFVITGFDYMSTRDWARLGLLYLHDGVWNGERILPDGFAGFVSTPAPADPSRGYGGLFWLNRGGAMPRLPADAYWAAGYMGQTTMVIPSRDLVVVRQGPSSGRDQRYFEELVGRVLRALPDRAAPGGIH
jgi:CubicO group peptidase (beta-lactamase class C family)